MVCISALKKAGGVNCGDNRELVNCIVVIVRLLNCCQANCQLKIANWIISSLAISNFKLPIASYIRVKWLIVLL